MTEGVSQTEGAATAAPSASKGSGLDLVGLTKVFPGGTLAVDDVNLHVEHGEYVVLLGPSGCGKTTTLRMIGGHEFPSEGDIVLDGESLVDLPPHKRPTTTVFQHFALFPHRTVLDNVGFGLKMEGMGKEPRRAKAMEALDMVGLTELRDRKPAALSGGQQQRVALARVLVTKPKALLLDEPLGDLDRLLQLRMRVELRNLQRQLGLMFIHVTHNQEEALSMADRVVVVNASHLRASVVAENGRGPAVGDDAFVSVRAASVELADAVAGEQAVNSADCEIVFVEFLGDLVKLHLTSGGERMLAKVPGDRYPALRGREGETIRIVWKEEDVQLLDS